MPECSDPSNRKLVNPNSGSVLFCFVSPPGPSYGFKVKALDIRSVNCGMSDIMVDAFVKFS